MPAGERIERDQWYEMGKWGKIFVTSVFDLHLCTPMICFKTIWRFDDNCGGFFCFFFCKFYFSTFLIRIYCTIIENSKTVSTSLTFDRFQSSAKCLLLIFLKFGNIRKFSFYRICRGLVAAYLVDSKKLLSYDVAKVQGSAGAKFSAEVILHMQETNLESYIYIIS